MKFSVLTTFPQLISEAIRWGVVGRALEKNLFQIHSLNPRDFTEDIHKSVDDRPFGGGDGMVLLYEPLAKAMESENLKNTRRIYLSPTGKRLNEELVQELSQETHVTLLCGRYGGVDQRFLQQYQFESVSVGDYVVSGGELPALLLIDAVVRKIPGTLGHQDSAQEDSFAQGPFFEAPLFTRPRHNEAGEVPDFLLSGDHKKIAEIRRVIGQTLTLQSRPETELLLDWTSHKKILLQIPKKDLFLMGFHKDFLYRFLGDEFGKN